jgi:hypothetical protein
MGCSNHYHAHVGSDYDPKNWVEWVQEENITRVFLMNETVGQFSSNINLEKNNHYNLVAYILSPISDEDFKKIAVDAGFTICSIFGCVETSGPLFMPTWTAEQKDTLNRQNMEYVLDDFYKIKLNDNSLLEVKLPDTRKICTGDKFEIIGNQWLHKGRENIYKINNNPVYLDLLINCVENFLGKFHSDYCDVVIDSEKNMIYIRVDSEINLVEANNFIKKEILFYQLSEYPYTIHKQIVGKRSEFITGIKFDQDEIRLRCRMLP